MRLRPTDQGSHVTMLAQVLPGYAIGKSRLPRSYPCEYIPNVASPSAWLIRGAMKPVRILIAEDDVLIAMFLEELLDAMGMRAVRSSASRRRLSRRRRSMGPT